MPTTSNTHIDKAISQLMLRRLIEPSKDLICNKLFTPLTVDRDSDKYYKFDDANSMIPETERKGGAEANSTQYDFSTGSFQATRKALKHFIDDDIYSNADEVIKRNYRKSAAMNIVDQLLLDKESRAAGVAFNTGNFSGKTAALSGTDQWSDYANSTPFETISEKAETVLQNCGKQPNTIIMGQQVWTQLRNHPQLIDRLPDNRTRAANINLFKEMLSDQDLNIENVLVGRASENTGTAASPTWSFIWGKFCLVAYISPNASTVMDRTLAKTFVPKDLAGMQVEYYRLDNYKGLFVEANTKYVHEIVDNNCGYLLSTVVA
jgi:hypothetical protein